MKKQQKKTKEITAPVYMMNRELSWLKFNERVLNEAGNPRVPLAERLTFVSIYQSNLDEFYRVRVGTTKYNYNGYAQKPTVKVVGSDGKVISPTYYKVTYSKGLTARGTYAVKITFKGKYSGSIKKYFKIV